MTRFYQSEQLIHTISSFDSAEFNLIVEKRVSSSNIDQILREIEQIDAAYHNLDTIRLLETRRSCLSTINEVVQSIKDHWAQLREHREFNAQDAETIYQSASETLTKFFNFYNRLTLIEYCLKPHRLYLAQRRG